jgi:hypothetical protein
LQISSRRSVGAGASVTGASSARRARLHLKYLFARIVDERSTKRRCKVRAISGQRSGIRGGGRGKIGALRIQTGTDNKGGIMEWWIIGGLVIVVLILSTLYRKSLHENRSVVYYELVLLLHDGIYRDHRAKLAQYVASLDAKNAYDLGGKVYIATGNMAAQIRDSRTLAAGLLWDLKTGKLQLS